MKFRQFILLICALALSSFAAKANSTALKLKVGSQIVDIAASDILCVRADLDQQNSSPIVKIKISKAGTKPIVELTSKNISKTLMMYSGDQLVWQGVIIEKFSGQSFILSGNGSIAQVDKLAKKIGVRDIDCSPDK